MTSKLCFFRRGAGHQCTDGVPVLPPLLPKWRSPAGRLHTAPLQGVLPNSHRRPGQQRAGKVPGGSQGRANRWLPVRAGGPLHPGEHQVSDHYQQSQRGGQWPTGKHVLFWDILAHALWRGDAWSGSGLAWVPETEYGHQHRSPLPPAPGQQSHHQRGDPETGPGSETGNVPVLGGSDNLEILIVLAMSARWCASCCLSSLPHVSSMLWSSYITSSQMSSFGLRSGTADLSKLKSVIFVEPAWDDAYFLYTVYICIYIHQCLLY